MSDLLMVYRDVKILQVTSQLLLCDCVPSAQLWHRGCMERCKAGGRCCLAKPTYVQCQSRVCHRAPEGQLSLQHQAAHSAHQPHTVLAGRSLLCNKHTQRYQDKSDFQCPEYNT